VTLLRGEGIRVVFIAVRAELRYDAVGAACWLRSGMSVWRGCCAAYAAASEGGAGCCGFVGAGRDFGARWCVLAADTLVSASARMGVVDFEVVFEAVCLGAEGGVEIGDGGVFGEGRVRCWWEG
jgi:hypothetical protein